MRDLKEVMYNWPSDIAEMWLQSCSEFRAGSPHRETDGTDSLDGNPLA
jgi:hypothetical protein